MLPRQHPFNGTSVAILVFPRLLHLESLADRTTELSFPMVDVPFQLRHRDATLFAGHVATIATLLCHEERHGFRLWPERRKVQRGLLVRFGMLLSP